MLHTIKTISEFKKMATLTHDNHEIASSNWAKTWGLGYWFDVWFYKEYSFYGLKYRTGQVIGRHTKHSVTKYYAGDKEISKKEFFGLIATIEYRPKITIMPTRKKVEYKQLSLF